jgi:hypothetical protein
MSDEPLNAAGNGRTAGGKFAPGNRVGRGNPNNAKAQKLRNAALRAVSRGDIAEIMQAMVRAAKSGDAVAAKFVCDRVLGKVAREDVIERIEALEALLANRNGTGGKGWN